MVYLISLYSFFFLLRRLVYPVELRDLCDTALYAYDGPFPPSCKNVNTCEDSVCKKDNTCENSVFVWAPGTLVQIHTAGVCVISCSVRKWGAPHFRHTSPSHKGLYNNPAARVASSLRSPRSSRT